MDGRIDDAHAGWKGRALYANYGTHFVWHIEGGKGTKGKVVKFQIRPTRSRADTLFSFGLTISGRGRTDLVMAGTMTKKKAPRGREHARSLARWEGEGGAARTSASGQGARFAWARPGRARDPGDERRNGDRTERDQSPGHGSPARGKWPLMS